MKRHFIALLCLLLAQAVCAQENKDAIDWDKARSLFQRSQRGEKLSAEEQAYLDHAKKMRGQRRENRPETANASKVIFNQAPLSELKGEYKGQDGGLYGKGQNEPPAAQLKAALKAAAAVQPLDATGKPAKDGKIGLVSIGMSNTTMEFKPFVESANAFSGKNPALIIVDGAQGGRDSQSWVEAKEKDERGRSDPWKVLQERMQKLGITPEQVQVVWIKQARIGPARIGEFPAHAKTLEDDLEVIIHQARKLFPNIKLAYLSSRTFAGYANTQLNPEPYAYESAFSVRWLIEKQMQGDAALNFDPVKGEVKAPVLLWGPYLWTNGTAGRKLDDLKWTTEDVAKDGTHPSASGQRKVAALLLHFFQTDPTAKSWFLKSASAK